MIVACVNIAEGDSFLCINFDLFLFFLFKKIQKYFNDTQDQTHSSQIMLCKY